MQAYEATLEIYMGVLKQEKYYVIQLYRDWKYTLRNLNHCGTDIFVHLSVFLHFSQYPEY